jgi:hypothetical protein
MTPQDLDDVSGSDATPPPETNNSEELRWKILNLSVMPVWVAMIVAPDSRLTKRLVRASNWWLAAYCAAYVAGLATTATSTRTGTPGTSSPSPMSSAGVRSGMLSDARAFHTGWVHYLAFDLFVGRWIWRQALAEGRSSRLALIATLFAGPLGLGIFGLQRSSLAPEHRALGSRRRS